MSWAKYKRLSSSKDLSIFRRGTTAFDGDDGGGGGGNDPDAQAYIDALDAAGYTVSGAEETAINTFVLALKADGIWAKSKAIYPFIGGTAATHKFNLKDPRDLNAAFRLTFFGGWTHSATGSLPNGTNGYAETYLDPSTDLPEDSASIGIYLRTTNSNNQAAIANGSNFQLFTPYNNKYWATLNGWGPLTPDVADNLGLAHAGIDAVEFNVFKNGVKIAQMPVNTSKPNPSGQVKLATRLNTFYLSKEIAFAHLSESVTDTEAADLYTIVQALQTALNREV
jgi:hypothetical protein